MSGADDSRVEVLFEGHVQGVGFRYTVQHIARSFAVTGFVRNLPDGRVALTAEGEKSELKSFVDHIRSGPLRKYIYHHSEKWSNAQGSFHSFKIAY